MLESILGYPDVGKLPYTYMSSPSNSVETPSLFSLLLGLKFRLADAGDPVGGRSLC